MDQNAHPVATLEVDIFHLVFSFRFPGHSRAGVRSEEVCVCVCLRDRENESEVPCVCVSETK